MKLSTAQKNVIKLLRERYVIKVIAHCWVFKGDDWQEMEFATWEELLWKKLIEQSRQHKHSILYYTLTTLGESVNID